MQTKSGIQGTHPYYDQDNDKYVIDSDLELASGKKITGITDNLAINTDLSTKTVRINSRTYTVAASIIGMQTKPRAGVAMTNDIIGIESMPGMNSDFANTVAGIVCFKAEPYIGSTAGAIAGDVRGYEVSLGCPSGAGTIAGVLSGIKLINNTAKAVTGGIYAMHVAAAGDAQPWSGLCILPDDGEIATTSGDKSGGTKGWIKCKIGTTVMYIQAYVGA